MTLQTATDFEFEQRHLHRWRARARLANQFVDRYRRARQQVRHTDFGGATSGRSSSCHCDWASCKLAVIRDPGMPSKPESSSMTSSTDCTSTAPSRMSWLQPCERGSSGEPGTAMTSRPISPASRAR